MDVKKFKMIDEGFVCLKCQRKVKPLLYSARDHCPYCLYSVHVDINPGDRLNFCHGLLKPTGIEKFRNTYKIIYQCNKCKKFHKNIMAMDDNMEEIIRLSSNYKNS